ncbi:MAG TPA: hypothetical protein PL070_08790 [Flavobacteriales bacterium]|nr:hypothetical protein [Flavobacteriales bacterium]
MKNLNVTKNILYVALFALASLFAGAAGASIDQNSLDPIFPSHEMGAVVIGAGAFGVQLYAKYAKPKNARFGDLHMAGIAVELWADRIVEPLFADNSVLSKVKRVDDQYILNGSVVHIPQAGAAAGVTKNRTVFPGVVQQRTDTDITYALDVFTSDPVLITKAEEMEISYKKMDSVLGMTPKNILTVITNDMLYSWAASGAAQILRTTGDLVATNLAPSATGTRRKITYADLVEAGARMDEQDVPSEDRFALFDPHMYKELLTDPEVTKVNGEKLADRAKGIVAEIAGFKIMKRSKNTVFTGATPPVKKAPGASGVATDNRSVLLWQMDCLNAALGTVHFFETINSAEHYGDIYSALIKAGGRQERADGFGVLSLVQASV